MIVILGLVLLVAAIVVGVAGVFANHGSAHALTHGFSVLGYHVTGSTGTLFLYGLVVGAVAVFGLGLLLTSLRHTARLGRAARRGLAESRGETVAARKDRDDMIDQRQAARAETASVLSNSSAPGDGHLVSLGRPPRRRHRLGRRTAPRQDATITPVESASASTE
jgi:uncharacterized membrane protein YciS (DUF1049 family)